MARILSRLAPLFVLVLAIGFAPALQPARADIVVPELPRTDDGTIDPNAPAPVTPAPVSPEPTAPEAATPAPPPPPNANPPTPPNAPGQETEKAVWYVSPSGVALGPFAVSKLVQMATDKEIIRTTPVWKEGMAEWALLEDMPELAQVAAAVPKGDKGTPPPPQNTQAMLDKKMKDFLVGTWRYEGMVNSQGYSYYMVVEATYRPDGTYAGSLTMQLPPQGGYQAPPYVSPLSGNYEIVAIDESNFVLTLFDRNNDTSKSSLRIVDRNTLENGNDPNKRSYRIR